MEAGLNLFESRKRALFLGVESKVLLAGARLDASCVFNRRQRVLVVSVASVKCKKKKVLATVSVLN